MTHRSKCVLGVSSKHAKHCALFYNLSVVCIVSALSVVPRLANAEGSNELGTTHKVMEANTDLYVDILDYTVETFSWSGYGGAYLYDPSNNFVEYIQDGDTVLPTQNGSYKLDINKNQSEGFWDLSVDGAEAGRGRVWSYRWHLNSTCEIDADDQEDCSGDANHSADEALNISLYAAVDTGGVVEVVFEGISGESYTIYATASGVDSKGARSTPMDNNSATGDHRIYLNPPESAEFEVSIPVINAAAFDSTAPGQECSALVVDDTQGEFTFTSSGDGTAHVVCDMDDSGTYDFSSDVDVHLVEPIVSGINAISWDGKDNTGTALAPNHTYTCAVIITHAEVHIVLEDAETAYPGMRMFQLGEGLCYSLDEEEMGAVPVETETSCAVAADCEDDSGLTWTCESLERTSLSMYWNDADVITSAVNMGTCYADGGLTTDGGPTDGSCGVAGGAADCLTWDVSWECAQPVLGLCHSLDTSDTSAESVETETNCTFASDCEDGSGLEWTCVGSVQSLCYADGAVTQTACNVANGVSDCETAATDATYWTCEVSVGAENSGENGMQSGDYDDVTGALANINARAWGDFTGVGRGEGNFVDTYVFLESTGSAAGRVEVVITTADDTNSDNDTC